VIEHTNTREIGTFFDLSKICVSQMHITFVSGIILMDMSIYCTCWLWNRTVLSKFLKFLYLHTCVRWIAYKVRTPP